MSPERWQKVKGVFEAALELDGATRASFLNQACETDASLRTEVESLLAAHDDASSQFFAPIITTDPMLGRHVGTYRILRRIGAGGMGAVYLASRDDDQFRRLAAVKAIRPDLLDDHTRRRFENERHTLAALEHPNIVKLLDGGTTDDGIPYLIMDYVEGQPIDRYCRDSGLTLRERLALFRPLCAAVHYAHQNLVVHRDLKPANILVSPQGVPKLLDFGIAKLLRPAYAAATVGFTRTEAQPMTPEFASPEQILGQPITTASDVYALGVLLYVLLTDAHPFHEESKSSHQMERAICEGEAKKPSDAAPPAWTRQLKGDLDLIILTAMRKEPQRRYASAEHLSEDLRRFLSGEPLAARGDTILYRAQKFVIRHKAAVTATAIAAALLVALGINDHSNRLKAERRFQDLRSFANFAIQDLDKAMRDGLTPARKSLTVRALAYLDGLAREAKGDTALQLELVAGYLKVADVQGNLFVANVGEQAAANESAQKAFAIAQEVYRRDSVSAPARAALARSREKLGDLLGPSGNRTEALDHYRQALELSTGESLPAFRIGSKVAQIQGDAFDPAAALESYRGCERAGLDWVAKNPDDPVARNALALARERIAWFAMLSGEPSGAEDAVRSAIATYEVATPTPRSRRNLAMAYQTLAEVQKRTAKSNEALASCRRSLALSETLLEADPQNSQFAIDVVQEKTLLIELLLAVNDQPAAKSETAGLLAQLKPRVSEPKPSIYYLANFVAILTTTPFAEFLRPEEAISAARKAVEITASADPESLDLLARAYAQAGQRTEAIAAEQKAIALLPPARAGKPKPETRTKLETALANFQSGK